MSAIYSLTTKPQATQFFRQFVNLLTEQINSYPVCLGAEWWFLEIAKKTKPSLGWPFQFRSDTKKPNLF